MGQRGLLNIIYTGGQMFRKGHINDAFIVHKLTAPYPIKIQIQFKNYFSTDSTNSFAEEHFKSHIPITEFQRFLLAAGSSVAALIDPRRNDMISCLGETTGVTALQKNLEIMKQCDEGLQILQEKPRINSRTIELDELGRLPPDTFGYHYKIFLDTNGVTPDSRMSVQFIDDQELAYVMTRYRECHDLVHTILGMPTNMLGEVAVKWFEALNNGLPMCYGGAIFGAFRLRPKQRRDYVNKYLPWALKVGRESKPLMPVYWEKHWNKSIDELRKELNISVLKYDKTVKFKDICVSTSTKEKKLS